ncbi:alpha-xenorhabdolysin family binary toxin subunit A [Vibrio sp. IB15]|uniref:Alpha-xenorhabdolysin family binary toxin subunit A n=1 Tax=Vibrio chagasii TaxID=170679 RepID=A0A7V7NUS1_9VIBR|nr:MULTISPECIES: alpha-xenorhabdolysin family binary toxin subunit A [Vibrio]KAB0480309.1 hypothetical protein F7Q91_09300 [Vibrio chagasii]MBJ2145760.1 alpha-xenorhabdolysin family binary toxin subunit A [Vibrio sp. IB15]
MERRFILKGITASIFCSTLPMEALSKGLKNGVDIYKENSDVDRFAGKGVFVDEYGKFILTDHHWLQIQMYITHALSLPTTEKEFTTEFSIPEHIDVSGFDWLMSCYQELKQSAEKWNNKTFRSLLDNIQAMSGWCSFSGGIMEFIYWSIENLQYAADIGNSTLFENTKGPLVMLLREQLKFAIPRAEEAEKLAREMIDFQTLLIDQQRDLETLESRYGDLIGNYDENSIKEDIEDLKKEIDALNKEYARLVTIAATTPTYAWVPFWGWFIAPAVAGVYGSQAAEVNRQREEKIQELNELEISLDHGLKIFRSWQLARQSIQSTDMLIGPATNSLGHLIGQWQAFVSSMELVISTIEELDCDLKDPTVGYILAEYTADSLGDNWLALSEKCQEFINSVTIRTYH